MSSKKDRRRVFFDVTVDGNLAGRIVMELYNDLAPRTCYNFLMLCTGMAGNGKISGKPLHYKGSTFHRVIKNFMIQGGDFTKGDGTGGESVYGGMFDDEEFVMKHDEPFVLSMANKGPNTNGSQFFITTTPAPHLNNVHVVFGKVVSGQEVVTQIEHLKTNSKNRPLADVVILNCGELVRRKKRRSAKSSDSSSSSASDEKSHKKAKKKKAKRKKRDNNERIEQSEVVTVVPEAEIQVSSIKQEDLPEEPEHKNQYLMRRSKSPEHVKKEKKSKPRHSPQRFSRRDIGQRLNRTRRTRTGHKIKGRGALRFRTPEGSSDHDGSRTPPHWRREQNRLVTLEELHRIQEKKKALEHAESDITKNAEANDKDKVDVKVVESKRHESIEKKHRGKVEARQNWRERKTSRMRRSPEHVKRHFTEDKNRQKTKEVENAEEKRRTRKEESDKEKGEGDRRERFAARNDDEKRDSVNELRLEEPSEEVVLDDAEDIRDSDDEALRMQLLKAKGRMEEKTEPESKTVVKRDEVEEKKEQKIASEKTHEDDVEKRRHHQENITDGDESHRSTVPHKAGDLEMTAGNRRRGRGTDHREHRRYRSRSTEKNQKGSTGREKPHEEVKEKEGTLIEKSQHVDAKRLKNSENQVKSDGDDEVSVNGNLKENTNSAEKENENITKGESTKAESKKVEEVRKTNGEKSRNVEKIKAGKTRERSHERKRSRSSGRRRRSLSRRSRSRERHSRSRSRSRGYKRSFERWPPRSRRPTRRELYDERMRMERERRRSLEKRSYRKRSKSSSSHRDTRRHSRRSRRHSSSTSSSSDSSSSRSRSTSSTGSSKRSSSSSSSRSSHSKSSS